MPFVAPEFQGEGDAGQAFNRGEDSGMSMMERAQQMQIQKQQADRQAAIAQITLPALQAKQQADIATAKSQLDQFQAQQNLRQQYLPVINQARQQFHDNQLIPDINDRARANTAWLGQYAPIANLPEYNGEFQTYQHLATQTTQDQMKIAGLANTNEINAQRIQSLQLIAGGKAASNEKIAGVRAQSAVDRATILAAASTENAQTKAGELTPEQKNIGAYVDALNRGDTASASMMEDSLQAKAGMAPTKIADSLSHMSDTAEKLAATAKANGDDAGYQQNTATVNALRSRAFTLLQSAPATVAAPVKAPQPTNPGVHPIYRDDKGNRAYLIDGKYVPVQ